MPRRNSRKAHDAAGAVFHVYNRGAGGGLIFRDDADKRQFLHCFKRHLSEAEFRDSSGRRYRKLRDSVSLLSYNLMPNHYHLVVRQLAPRGLSKLMRSAIRGYVQYFNRRHGRTGAVFSGSYRAVAIEDSLQFRSVIAYVHTNHWDGPGYPWCSHNAYAEFAADPSDAPGWLDIGYVLKRFRRVRGLHPVPRPLHAPEAHPVNMGQTLHKRALGARLCSKNRLGITPARPATS